MAHGFFKLESLVRGLPAHIEKQFHSVFSEMCTLHCQEHLLSAL